MSWNKVEFQEFINEYNKDIVIQKAPKILYSKKDKEHEALNSLIAFFIVTGGLCIYIAGSIMLAPVWFTLVGFIIIIAAGTIIDIFLIFNYLKSSVFIRPIECWVEIFRYKDDFCFVFYPIFSGKCHPNKAKNIIFKCFQEEILKSKIDITQIEVYFNKVEGELRAIGFFFQYGEGKAFIDEKIDYTSWKFFPYEKSLNENYLATANWDHQYEWKNDLAFDFDKLHSYAQWVVKSWNAANLKPLTADFKKKMNWSLRNIESIPKLKPWDGKLESQTYEDKNTYRDLELIDKAIEKFIGKGKEIEGLKDLKKHIFYIQEYFRTFNRE